MTTMHYFEMSHSFSLLPLPLIFQGTCFGSLVSFLALTGHAAARGASPSLGLRVLIREVPEDAESSCLPAQVAASGEIGIEEDVGTQEDDGIETTDAGPESVLLGCLAITWRRWEREMKATGPLRRVGGRDRVQDRTLPALAPRAWSRASVHQVRFSICRKW